jgi:hypothetical protein
VRDSFFELGADSVRVVHIGARLSVALGRTVPLLALFEHPNARLLARHLSGADDSGAAARQGQERGRLRRAPVRRPRPSGGRP